MFGIDVVVMAYVLCGLLVISAFMAMCLSLMRRKVAKALGNFAVMMIIAGVWSVLVYQAQWAAYAVNGAEPTWGMLPDWFYAAPFVIGVFAALVGGLLQGFNLLVVRNGGSFGAMFASFGAKLIEDRHRREMMQPRIADEPGIPMADPALHPQP